MDLETLYKINIVLLCIAIVLFLSCLYKTKTEPYRQMTVDCKQNLFNELKVFPYLKEIDPKDFNICGQVGWESLILGQQKKGIALIQSLSNMYAKEQLQWAETCGLKLEEQPNFAKQTAENFKEMKKV